jgi:hypothetical protein
MAKLKVNTHPRYPPRVTSESRNCSGRGAEQFQYSQSRAAASMPGSKLDAGPPRSLWDRRSSHGLPQSSARHSKRWSHYAHDK